MKKTVSLTEVQLKDIINRVVSEQISQVTSGLKQAMASKPQGGQVPFNPTHIGGYEIDCKSRQVKLNTKGVVFKPEGTALLIDVFCNPKYRSNSTPPPVTKQTAPVPAKPTSAPARPSQGNPLDGGM